MKTDAMRDISVHGTVIDFDSALGKLSYTIMI